MQSLAESNSWNEDPGEWGLRHGLLGRDFDVLSPTAALAFVVGDQRCYSSLGTGAQIRLGNAHRDRRTVVVDHLRPG